MNFCFERKINYYETDKMGIVHHSNYIRFLEEARCQMLETMKVPYKHLEDLGIMIPVLGVNCSYKTHVTYDDIICIHLYIKELTGVRMTVGYNVTNKVNDVVVLTGETKHCFVDKNLKPIRLPKAFPEIYEVFESCMEN